MRYDTDRSSDPARMATVWPTATMPSATLRWRMLVMLPLAKNVPPSTVTTSQPTTTMTPSAAQIGVPATASRPGRRGDGGVALADLRGPHAGDRRRRRGAGRRPGR